MGNKVSYFEDQNLENIFGGQGNWRRRDSIGTLKTYFRHRPNRYFRNDDQVIKVLEQIPDSKLNRTRYRALILIVDRIHEADRTNFNGNRILASVNFYVPGCRALLEVKGIKVNEYDFTRELLEKRKIRTQTLETVSEDSNPDSACVLCQQYRRRVLFSKCGHLILCPQCALRYQYKQCPLCREENAGLRLVYF